MIQRPLLFKAAAILVLLQVVVSCSDQHSRDQGQSLDQFEVLLSRDLLTDWGKNFHRAVFTERRSADDALVNSPGPNDVWMLSAVEGREQAHSFNPLPADWMKQVRDLDFDFPLYFQLQYALSKTELIYTVNRNGLTHPSYEHPLDEKNRHLCLSAEDCWRIDHLDRQLKVMRLQPLCRQDQNIEASPLTFIYQRQAYSSALRLQKKLTSDLQRLRQQSLLISGKTWKLLMAELIDHQGQREWQQSLDQADPLLLEQEQIAMMHDLLFSQTDLGWEFDLRQLAVISPPQQLNEFLDPLWLRRYSARINQDQILRQGRREPLYREIHYDPVRNLLFVQLVNGQVRNGSMLVDFLSEQDFTSYEVEVLTDRQLTLVIRFTDNSLLRYHYKSL